MGAHLARLAWHAPLASVAVMDGAKPIFLRGRL